jgi:hypothetical protein
MTAMCQQDDKKVTFSPQLKRTPGGTVISTPIQSDPARIPAKFSQDQSLIWTHNYAQLFLQKACDRGNQINTHYSTMNAKSQLILIRPWRKADLLLLSIGTQKNNSIYSQTQITPTRSPRVQAEQRNETRRKQALDRRKSSDFQAWDPRPPHRPHRPNRGLPENR